MANNALSAEGLDAEYKAGKWDFINDLKEQPRQGAITAWLAACNALDSVLEVGCGEGNLCRYLLPLGVGDYLGIDLSEAALDVAARSFPTARFERADFTTFEPPSGKRFSAVLFNEVLSYTEDQAGQIERYRPFVAEGGVMVLSMYQPSRPESGAHAEIAEAWAATETENWQVLDDIVLKSTPKNITWRLRLSRPL